MKIRIKNGTSKKCFCAPRRWGSENWKNPPRTECSTAQRCWGHSALASWGHRFAFSCLSQNTLLSMDYACFRQLLLSAAEATVNTTFKTGKSRAILWGASHDSQKFQPLARCTFIALVSILHLSSGKSHYEDSVYSFIYQHLFLLTML